MADQHPAPGQSFLRWWVPAALGIVSIVTGVTLQVLPDMPLRVAVGVLGAALVLYGIARLRRLGAGWAVLAPVVAAMWLLSGLLQLVIAVTVDGPATPRLLALGGVSTLVGTAFAVWPRSLPLAPAPGPGAPDADPSGPGRPDDLTSDATEAPRWDACSPSSPGSFRGSRCS
jgi:hypothetical protein